MRRSLKPALTLGEIVAALGGRLEGDPAQQVDRLTSLRSADERSISFLVRPQQRDAAVASRAAAYIVSPALATDLAGKPNLLIDPDPYLYYARLAALMDERVNPAPSAAVAPSARIDSSACVSASATIGESAVIGARTIIGERAWIGAGCVIGEDCRIGAASRLHPNVTLLSDCDVGERVIIHSGTVIGADGFGFAPDQGRWEKIEQLGDVVVGDDVEIGANTCIDRGAVGDTVIGDGVKIDNLVQIAHGVRIGRNVRIAACSGVAGSTVIEDDVVLAGQVGVANHLRLGRGAQVASKSAVFNDLEAGRTYAGIPAIPIGQWRRWAVKFRRGED